MSIKNESSSSYNSAKIWQLFLYPAGRAGHIAFMVLASFLSFYATGVAGLGVVLVSTILTGARIFDGITDPLTGLLIDKTNGKFGKARPWIIGGYLLMAVCVLIIFYTTHLVPESIRLVYFVVIYFIYMLGFGAVGTTIAATEPILTNDPKQRPMVTGIGLIYTSILMSFMGMLTAQLAGKHGGLNNPGFFQELVTYVLVISTILLSCTIIAIWSKDRSENFNISKKNKIKFKDMWLILKDNRPLQLFIVTGATDKLALQIAGNQVINVMLFGIIIGNFEMSGIMATLILVPNILTLMYGMRLAGKVGTKKAYVTITRVAILLSVMCILLLVFGNPREIGFDNIGFMTIAFVTLFIALAAVRNLTMMFSAPMIPDIIDYENYRTGRFAPGVIASVYSFIDKSVSSFQTVLVGLALAAIGFREAFPDIDTPYSEGIFVVTLFLAYGVLIICWIISLICMKFYPLDKERMAEIQEELKARKTNKENDDNKNIKTETKEQNVKTETKKQMA